MEEHMDNMHISYTSAVHFLTVVKHMNMNRAAEDLYITQPALSLSISKLEKGLGVKLFHRTRNKLILSKEAEILLPHMEKYRQAHDLLLQEAANLKEASENSVNIAYSGSPYTFSMYYFSNILSSYDKAHVNVAYVDSKVALNLLITGQVDFAIANTTLSHPLISSIILLTEPIGIVLPAKHILASRESLLFNDIQKIRFHGLSPKHDFRILCDNICHTQGVTPDYITENDYSAYHKCMEANDKISGFFSTKQNYNLNFAPIGEYVYREVDNSILNRKISIYYISIEKKQYQHDKLIELIQKVTIMQSALTSKLSKIINEDFMDEIKYIQI